MKQDDTESARLMYLAARRRKAQRMMRIHAKRRVTLSGPDKKDSGHEHAAHYLELRKQKADLRKNLRPTASSFRYAESYDFAPVGYFLFDNLGMVRDVNKAGEDLLGRSKHLLLNKSFCEFLDDGPDREIFRAHLNNVFLRKALQTCEVHIKADRATPLYAQLHSVLAEDAGVGAGFVSTIAVDISERKLAEETCKEMSAKLHTLIQSMPDAVFFKDSRRRYAIVNSAFEEFVTLDQKMILGKTVDEVMPADYAKNCNQRDEAVIKSGKPLCIEDAVTNRKGMKKIFSTIKAPLYDPQGNLLGLLGVSRDVTESKRFEAALQQSETNYRTLMDQASDGIAIADPQGRYIDVNSRMCEMTGYLREEFLQLSVKDLLDPDNGSKDPLGLSELAAKQAILTERLMRRKDGSTFPSEISAKILPDGSLYAAFRDITEQEQTVDALRVTEDTLRTVTNSVKDAIVIMDDEDKVSFWNPAAEKMFDIASYEALGLKMHELIAPQRYLDAYQRGISAYKTTGRGSLIGKTFEIVARKKDGTEFPVEISLSSIRFKDKWYAAGIMRDISERKKAEEQLRRSHDELENLVTERTAELTMANEQLRNLSVYLQNARENERTTIAREIHDDLGQSLTALKIDFSLLRKRLPAADKTIAEKAESIAGLIEATTQSVKRISSDLRPGILDHLGLTAAIEWQAEEFEKRTGIPCTTVFKPREIVLDKDRTTTVFRIFQETLTNIARHAQATKVSVHLKVQTDGLMLQVQDNGIGISEKQISDPKSLGLIGIRERVNYWGGLLTIDGARPKGTMITVWIPLNEKN